MKLVAILGSPRGMKGNTGTLLDGVLQGAEAAGAKIELFSLAEKNVQPCVSCERCHVVGDCGIHDDFGTILEAMKTADGLVLASPNYIMSVTAQMKAFLDRCSGPIHTQVFDGKYAAVVTTSGSPSDGAMEQYVERALSIIGYYTVGSVNAVGWQMGDVERRAPHMAAAEALGRLLVNAISTCQVSPEQAIEREMIMERFQQLVTMQKDHWKYEYEFWKARTGR